MAENIREIVKSTLKSAHWMDDESREVAIDKVEHDPICFVSLRVT